MTTHYPLPDLGFCPFCDTEIRVRKTGVLYAHGCPGNGRPTAHLEPTFARWLWTHAARRDAYDNWLTNLAVMRFRGCTQSPHLTPRDVTWTTAEELHGHLHARQEARTGSDIRQPYSATRCDWACRDVRRAGEIYGGLVSSRANAATPQPRQRPLARSEGAA